MNNLDKSYQQLLSDVLENGHKKNDRTGTGTISVFGRQIRHKMSQGFPVLTTKKMAWKTMVTELIWFLRGDTSIQFLIDNNCHIWDGDAYKKFLTKASEVKQAYLDGDLLGTQPHIESMFSNPNSLTILTQNEFINKIKTDSEFSKTWSQLGPVYGKQWRNWTNQSKKNHYVTPGEPTHNNKRIDQIDNLINDLKTNPDSRRLMVSAWNVGEIDQMTLPPCHYGFQVYTRELSNEERLDWMKKNRPKTVLPMREFDVEFSMDEFFRPYDVPKRAISLMWSQRSCDLFLGIPFNIASYGLLLEIIAKEVNMIPDELIGNLGDVHLYTNHIEQAKEQITRIPFELPTLKFYSNKESMDDISHYEIEDFELLDYQSHSTIKAPLSN
jgi:thymidylate synthase